MLKFGLLQKQVLIVFGVLVLCLILSGCQFSQSSQPDNYGAAKGCQDIAIFLPESQTAPRYEETDRPVLEKEIIKLLPGVTIRYFNANRDADKQLTQAQIALDRGACILVVDPVAPQQGAEIVKRAKAKNVPVIAYDRLIKETDKDTLAVADLAYYISFDNKKVGELMGEYIMEQLTTDKHYAINEGAKLVVINGSEDDNNAKLLRSGALEELGLNSDETKLPNQKAKFNKIFDEFTPSWNGQTAAQRVFEQLATDKDITIVLVANDTMADAIINILPESQKGKILVTGQDGTVQSMANIINCSQAMTVYKPASQIAEQTALLVATLSKGEDTRKLMNTTTKAENNQKIPTYLEIPIRVDRDNLAKTAVKTSDNEGIIDAKTLQNLCQKNSYCGNNKPDACQLD